MKVEILDSFQEKAWNEFIDQNDQASFYHLLGWKSVVERCFKYKTFYLMAKNNNKIEGILPLILCDHIIFGRRLISMPFLNFGGICALTPEAETSLIQKAKLLTHKTKAKYLELRHTRRTEESLQVKTNKVSMTINLKPDPQILWNNFSGKLRTDIRKAEKIGLYVKSGKVKYVDSFYYVLSRNYNVLGTPVHQKRFFHLMLEELEPYIQIFVVYYKEKPVGSAMNGLFKDKVEGMWAGSLTYLYPHLRINYLLYWKMIEDACERGYKYYHLGRSSKDSGALKFKEKWLAQPKQLYWEYYVNGSEKLPQLAVDNPKYHLPIRIWQSLPLSVTSMIGPLLAPGIP